MLIHSHVPKTFSDTLLLVPIIEYKNGVITDIDDYRLIDITSVALKVFAKIILSRIQDCLYNNDNQFSCKVKHSTEMCIVTLKSIIDYYISFSSPVCLWYVNASNALDRINFWNLVRRPSCCDSFAQDNDVKYNTKKTVWMFARPREFKSD